MNIFTTWRVMRNIEQLKIPYLRDTDFEEMIEVGLYYGHNVVFCIYSVIMLIICGLAITGMIMYVPDGSGLQVVCAFIGVAIVVASLICALVLCITLGEFRPKQESNKQIQATDERIRSMLRWLMTTPAEEVKSRIDVDGVTFKTLTINRTGEDPEVMHIPVDGTITLDGRWTLRMSRSRGGKNPISLLELIDTGSTPAFIGIGDKGVRQSVMSMSVGSEKVKPRYSLSTEVSMEERVSTSSMGGWGARSKTDKMSIENTLNIGYILITWVLASKIDFSDEIALEHL